MVKPLRRFLLLSLFCPLSIGSVSQTSPKTTPEKPDYSKEAVVVEKLASKISFENDGSNTTEASSRVRIQSDAGVQKFGVLTFPYQSAYQTPEIKYVRVLKPDGTTVTTPLDDVQDMPTEITRQAPFYSDLREKHVAVKGLGTGDVLEYAELVTSKPLAPGQFWFSYNFSKEGITLSESLEITVPKGRTVKWKSPINKPVITDEADHRTFRWSNSMLQNKSSEEEKKEQEEKVYELGRGRFPPPDVQVSSFQSWEEVGAWYSALQAERVKPSPEIRAKATELVKTAGDDDAKLRAIYTYVSTQFRYIGVAFGIGRYQPHSAAEVLANQYGDCKDKHTLLASLLEAVGIAAYPALINTFHELDLEVPSPAQFDHVITAVPHGDGFIWMDTTAEVAPFAIWLVHCETRRR
jgi:transglutaminase-like putative cysteine protease